MPTCGRPVGRRSSCTRPDWPTRKRFSLAHELGHHRLGHEPVIDTWEAMYAFDRPPEETQANAFAAEFVAPRAGIERWLEEHAHPPVNLDLVCRLSVLFGLSAESIRYRLATIGVLTDDALGGAAGCGDRGARARGADRPPGARVSRRRAGALSRQGAAAAGRRGGGDAGRAAARRDRRRDGRRAHRPRRGAAAARGRGRGDPVLRSSAAAEEQLVDLVPFVGRRGGHQLGEQLELVAHVAGGVGVAAAQADAGRGDVAEPARAVERVGVDREQPGERVEQPLREPSAVELAAFEPLDVALELGLAACDAERSGSGGRRARARSGRRRRAAVSAARAASRSPRRWSCRWPRRGSPAACRRRSGASGASVTKSSIASASAARSAGRARSR